MSTHPATPFRIFAAFLRLAPNAYMDDGLLDVALVRATNFQEFLRIMSYMLLFRRPEEPDVIVRRVRSLDIAATPPQPVHLDGDPYTHTPIRVWVEHQALTLMVPSGSRLPRHLLQDGVQDTEAYNEEERRLWPD